MISGRRASVHSRIAVICTLLLAATGFAATPEQIEAVVRSIDTPRDIPIPFVERRANQLLAEPLTLSGEILFTADGTLSKKVGPPFNESITISARRVEFSRMGKTKRLSLNRRPDIKAFYIGMQALLAGDASALLDSFDVVSTQNADDWSLDLVPREEKLRTFVSRMVIFGRASRVLRVRTEQPGGDWQEMSFDPATD